MRPVRIINPGEYYAVTKDEALRSKGFDQILLNAQHGPVIRSCHNRMMGWTKHYLLGLDSLSHPVKAECNAIGTLV